MANEELSADMALELTRQSEGWLAKVKYEYQKNLRAVDPLDRDALENMQTIFNQRLVIFQHEFMEYLARVRGGVNPHVEEFQSKPPPVERIPEIAASIIAGGGGAILVALIPVGTHGFLFWASTVTAAGVIGGAIGVPAGVATAGVGVVVGIAGGIATAMCLRSYRRKLIRQILDKKFDDEIAPRLRTWAKGKISAQ
jgi:hypothetical protein